MNNKEIQKFYDDIKSLRDTVEKHESKTIAFISFKEKVKAIFIEWETEMKQTIEFVKLESAKKLDGFLEKIYEESKKRQSSTSFLKENLNEVENILFREIIIPLKSKKFFISPDFQKYVNQVRDPDEKDFLNEAVLCVSINANRSVVIMAWIATMYNIYKKIESGGFNNFNRLYKRRFLITNPNKKVKTVRKVDDLNYYPDTEVLFICEDLGIIDRNQRGILGDCLKLRNMCAHPGKYKPKEKEVLLFLERITDIILSKYD